MRFVSFAVIWGISMMASMLIALSGDWAERFVTRCGTDDPIGDGRAIRFFVACFGAFIVPMIHIAIWELLISPGGG